MFVCPRARVGPLVSARAGAIPQRFDAARRGMRCAPVDSPGNDLSRSERFRGIAAVDGACLGFWFDFYLVGRADLYRYGWMSLSGKPSWELPCLLSGKGS